jgi:hypothetical protein
VVDVKKDNDTSVVDRFVIQLKTSATLIRRVGRVVSFESCSRAAGRDSHGERQRSRQMTDLIERTFHWFKERLPGRVSRPDNDSYVAATAISAKRVGRALRAVVHCQTPETQPGTQWKWNRNLPTSLKIVPRLSSFVAAVFVLLAVVNADAQQPTRRSVVIPPIPPGQARIWIYSGAAHQPF